MERIGEESTGKTTRLMYKTTDATERNLNRTARRRQHWECRITWAEVVGIETNRMDATKEPEDFPFLAENSRRRLAVLRRCPAPLIVLATALAFGLGSQPSSSRADGLVTLDYTLTALQNIAPEAGSPSTQNAPTPQVLASDSPISIASSASSTTGPLQIVTDSSGYYYNNPQELIVGVGSTTAPDGSPMQALGLTFYGQGLTAGNSMTFSLTFDQAIVGNNPLNPPVFTQIDPSTLKPIADPTVSIKYDGVATGTIITQCARAPLAAALVGPGRGRDVASPPGPSPAVPARSLVLECFTNALRTGGAPHPTPLPAAAGRGRPTFAAPPRLPRWAEAKPSPSPRRGEGARRADEGGPVCASQP